MESLDFGAKPLFHGSNSSMRELSNEPFEKLLTMSFTFYKFIYLCLTRCDIVNHSVLVVSRTSLMDADLSGNYLMMA
jgi:hypothetical protein